MGSNTRIRSICQEVIRILCATTKFVDSKRHPVARNEAIREKYLSTRVLSDHKREYHLTTAIHETLPYIFQEEPTLQSRVAHFTSVLYSAAARQPEKTYTIDRYLNRSIHFSDAHLHRVFIAAVLLDLTPLVSKLIQRGMKDYRTEFGTVVEAATYKNDFDLVQTLLDMKLHLGTDKIPENDRPLRHAVSLVGSLGDMKLFKLLLHPEYANGSCLYNKVAINTLITGGHLDIL